jgi:hypothetical protein
MNAARRKQIAEAIADLEKLSGALEDVKNLIESILDYEQEAFDAMPESLQSSERGEASQEAINNLEKAVSAFESFDVEEIVTQLSDAAA